MADLKLRAVFMILLASASRLWAEIEIVNPGLPARESLVYSRTTAKKAEKLTMNLVLREENGQAWYEYISSSPDIDVSARVDAATLFARYSESTTRQGGSTIKRSTTILEMKEGTPPNAVLLAGFETMVLSLRGFPFSSQKKAKLAFAGAGQQAGAFSFEFSVQGKETIVSGGRSWECWKTQIGLGGIFAAFGKTQLWYAVAAPHVLVRSEGASGPPGSPQILLELESYTGTGVAYKAAAPR